MKKTFREFYAGIDPDRRARIVFGVVTSRVQHLQSIRGDISQMTFDAAEYLTDEATIAAYLALIEGLKNPALSRKALSDAERARRRIVEEQIQSYQQSIPEEKKVQWIDRGISIRNFPIYERKTDARRPNRDQSSITVDRLGANAGDGTTKRNDWALKRLSKDSLT
jgi:hypothetical protein